MSLDNFFEQSDEDEIKSKIRQRRSQMLVHSYAYYIRDLSLVSDEKWQQWANELRDLQQQNPQCCKIDFFDKVFKDWNGDTGFHLPFHDPWVKRKAEYIIRIWKDE